jgi:hypothetical protein
MKFVEPEVFTADYQSELAPPPPKSPPPPLNESEELDVSGIDGASDPLNVSMTVSVANVDNSDCVSSSLE